MRINNNNAGLQRPSGHSKTEHAHNMQCDRSTITQHTEYLTNKFNLVPKSKCFILKIWITLTEVNTKDVCLPLSIYSLESYVLHPSVAYNKYQTDIEIIVYYTLLLQWNWLHDGHLCNKHYVQHVGLNGQSTSRVPKSPSELQWMWTSCYSLVSIC